jgi:hypothetical protein
MERRVVTVVDIGGAFHNANMEPTGIIVHMRLDRALTSMLLEIDGAYKQFMEPNGTVVVELEKALYGCVEASRLQCYGTMQLRVGRLQRLEGVDRNRLRAHLPPGGLVPEGTITASERAVLSGFSGSELGRRSSVSRLTLVGSMPRL